jgi:hypothetical protein
MISELDREKIAARWLIEQDDPSFTDDQRDELARWLVQSVENCRAYLRLVRAWRKVALLRRTQTPIMYGPRSTPRARVTALLAPRSRRKRKGVEAFDLGLITQLVAADELDSAVSKLAADLAAGPQLAIRTAKRLIYSAADHGLAEHLAAESHGIVNTVGHPDFVEGITAFLEKRPARFQ